MFLLTSPTSTAESCISLEKSPHRNLDCWDFQSTVLLDGVWDILPGITPTTISKQFLSREDWRPQDILRSWEQSGLPRSDFQVSYRLSLNLPKKAPQLFLLVGEAYSNTRIDVLSINGQFIRVFANASEQDFETYRAGRLTSRLVALPPLAEETTIIIQLSNGPYLSGGFYELPAIGTLSQLSQRQDRKHLFIAIALGAFLLLGLINLSLWLVRKNDMAQLFLAGLAFTMALRLIDTGKLLYPMYPDAEIIWFMRIGWFTAMLMTVLWSGFIRSLLPQHFPLWIHRVTTLLIAVSGLFLLVSGSDYWLQIGGFYARGLIFVILLFSIRAITYAIFSREQSSYYFLAGVSVLGITAIVDTIGQSLGYPLNTTIYGFLALVLFQTITLNKHYLFALTEQERLAVNLESLVTERTEELRVVNSRLTELAETDELTGLSNRRMFLSEFSRQKAIAKRGDETLSLAILDIDFFKSINDRWGHDAGDKTLKAFSNLLKSELRDTDVVARIGGEEFALLIRTDSYSVTVIKAKMICEKIAAENFSSVEGDFQITISIGLCEVASEDDVHSAMKRADDALYQAKNKGRNQVIS